MNVSSAMNKNKQSTCSGHDHKQPFPPLGNWLHSLLLLSLLAFLVSCSGGGGSAGDASPSPPAASTVTLSGTVYDSQGNPVSGVTVAAFSTETSTTTNASGNFSLNVAPGSHTLVLSKSAVITDTYSVLDIGSSTSGLSFLVQSTAAVNINTTVKYANSSFSVDSNAVGDCDSIGTLNIGNQGSGKYNIGGTLTTNANIYLYAFEPGGPFSFPLPPEGSLDIDPEFAFAVTRMAPSFVVSVSPARLQNLTNATLTMPNPDNLPAGTRILHFDYANHQWEDTGSTIGVGPTTITITEGGIYGIFQESGNQIGNVTVPTTAAAGSLVMLGDQVARTTMASETITFSNVHIPITNDTRLTAWVLDPSKTQGKLQQGMVTPLPLSSGSIPTVDFSGSGSGGSLLTSGLLTLSRSATSVLTGSSSGVTITALLLNDSQVPLTGIPVSFSTNSTGRLSGTSASTNANGEATVTFSAPNENSNKTATITASVNGLDSVTIPVLITGTTLTLDKDINLSPGTNDTLTITATNGAGNPLSNQTISVSISPSSLASVQLAAGYSEYKTASTTNLGQLKVVVTGLTAGTATINVSGLGTTATGSCAVASTDVTFSGTVYNTAGQKVSNAKVYSYSTPTATTTNANGAFSLAVAVGSHALLVDTDDGIYSPTYRLADIAGGENVNFLLRSFPSGVNLTLKGAGTGYSLTSNAINSNTATLAVPAQAGGKYMVGNESVATARLSVMLYDPHSPLPFPLPGFGTRDGSIATAIDIQAPSVVAAVSPTRLQNLVAATLTLPNPDNLPGTTKILHFDIAAHQWKDTGFTINSGTIPITQGGLYGIFDETVGQVGRAWINVTSASGSMVLLGDRIYTTLTDNEKFYLGDIFVPLDEVALTVMVLDPSNTAEPLQQKTMIPLNNELVTVQVGGGGTVTIPDSVSLKFSKSTIKTDDTDSTTITATVLDASNVGLEGVAVTFSANGGMITAPATVATGSDGTAAITFKSGPNKANAVVQVTATVSGLEPVTLPIQLSGTTITLTPTNPNLMVGGNNDSLIVALKDANNAPIYNTILTVSVTPDSIASVSLDSGYSGYRTDNNGLIRLKVKGLLTGTATINVSGQGTQAEVNYTVSATAPVFSLIKPATELSTNYLIIGPSTQISFNDSNPDTIVRHDTGSGGSFLDDLFEANDSIIISGSTGSNDGIYTITAVNDSTITLADTDTLNQESKGAAIVMTKGVLVEVQAPTQNRIKFGTTVGLWDGGSSQTIEKDVVDGKVSAVLSSTVAGTATVNITDVAHAATTVTSFVIFSAPSYKAATLSLQAAVTNLPPSVGGTTYSTTLTATVQTNDNQKVGGAAVAFSIPNPTGGGERLSNVVVFTDSAGIAQTTFTSGASTASDGVTIKATIVGSAINDTETIVIGGTPTSIIISAGTKIESSTDNTQYKLPISISVSTSTGSPAVGAVVSLRLWPLSYGTDCSWPTWNDSGNAWVYNNDSYWFNNEDSDRDMVLDLNEDGVFGLGQECEAGDEHPKAPWRCNGALNPNNAVVGTLQGLTAGTIVTDVTGSAYFHILYGKDYSRYTKVEITATLEAGVGATYSFILPYAVSDAANLSPSPFNWGSDIAAQYGVLPCVP